MTQRHVVQLKMGSKSSGIVPVPAKGEYVYDFLVAVKNQFPRKLSAYDADDLYIEADGCTSVYIGLEDPIDTLTGQKKPLVVVVEPQSEVVAQKPFFLSRHQECKARTSSRSYLTSVALELDEIYPIDKESSPTGIEKPLTFGTILSNAYHHDPDPFPQFQNKYPKLNDFFTVSEWNFLESLHDAVNGHLHRPLNPGSSTKQLILPSDFSGEQAICQGSRPSQMSCQSHHIWL